MKSFRFHGLESGIKLDNIPVPEPKEGQVLIAVEAAGLCRSDAHILHGLGTNTLGALPITLGHEVAGTVVKLGPGSSPVQVGDRVSVALIAHPPAAANWMKTVGLGCDGGYGEFVLAHNELLVKIPDGVTFPQAAVATDAIATSYHAVMAAGKVTKTSTVAIIGIGGLGLNAVAISALQGAKVYVIDVNTAKYEDAKRLGAVGCGPTLGTFADVVFDVIIDFVGTTSTVMAAVAAVKPVGSIVLVGLDSENLEIRSIPLVVKSISLKASFGSSKDELQQILDLIAEGKLSPKLTEIPFEDIPKGLEALNEGKVDGRLYTNPQVHH
ncbi:GroES-like protein [Xylariaceae sp. FL0662B]|nr:GroES-like protein [Xylariaceae sp. FL0662B]